MKFTATVLALFAWGATADSHSLQNKRVDARKLLRNAIPVNSKGEIRRLDQNANNGFQITAAHSIKFNQCLSLSTEPANYDVMFGDDVIAYTKQGLIISQKSYVLFNVCETQYCSYEADDEYLFMVDLPTYLGSLVDYLPQQKEEYCRGCEDAQDYCVNGAGEEAAAEEEVEEEAEGEAEGEEAEGEGEGEGEGEEQAEGEEGEGEGEEGEGEEGEEGEGEEGEGENRRRKLAKKSNKKARALKTTVYVDCDTCQANGCFNEDNGDDNQQSMDELVADWAQGMLECQQTEQYWQNMNLYAGFICNSQGTGVEVGIFLDDACEVYTMTSQYKNIVQNTDAYTYLMNSAQVVTYPFMNTISCAATEFASPYDQGDDADANNNQDDGDADDDGILDVCEELFNDGAALAVDDCNNNGQDDAEEEQQGDDAVNYDFYEWTLSQNNAENLEAVCYIIKSLEGEYSAAHIYNDSEEEGKGSGHVYNYNANGGKDRKGGKVFGIVLLIVLVVAGAVLAAQAMGKKRKNDKKTPLVSKRGALA